VLAYCSTERVKGEQPEIHLLQRPAPNYLQYLHSLLTGMPAGWRRLGMGIGAVLKVRILLSVLFREKTTKISSGML